MYDLYGHLLDVRTGLSSFQPEYLPSSIKRSALNNKAYKDHVFKLFSPEETDIPEEIDVPVVGIVNEILFTLEDCTLSKFIETKRIHIFTHLHIYLSPADDRRTCKTASS